jgi:hypothetical protein
MVTASLVVGQHGRPVASQFHSNHLNRRPVSSVGFRRGAKFTYSSFQMIIYRVRNKGHERTATEGPCQKPVINQQRSRANNNRRSLPTSCIQSVTRSAQRHCQVKVAFDGHLSRRSCLYASVCRYWLCLGFQVTHQITIWKSSSDLGKHASQRLSEDI